MPWRPVGETVRSQSSEPELLLNSHAQADDRVLAELNYDRALAKCETHQDVIWLSQDANRGWLEQACQVARLPRQAMVVSWRNRQDTLVRALKALSLSCSEPSWATGVLSQVPNSHLSENLNAFSDGRDAWPMYQMARTVLQVRQGDTLEEPGMDLLRHYAGFFGRLSL